MAGSEGTSGEGTEDDWISQVEKFANQNPGNRQEMPQGLNLDEIASSAELGDYHEGYALLGPRNIILGASAYSVAHVQRASAAIVEYFKDNDDADIRALAATFGLSIAGSKTLRLGFYAETMKSICSENDKYLSMPDLPSEPEAILHSTHYYLSADFLFRIGHRDKLCLAEVTVASSGSAEADGTRRGETPLSKVEIQAVESFDSVRILKDDGHWNILDALKLYIRSKSEPFLKPFINEEDRRVWSHYRALAACFSKGISIQALSMGNMQDWLEFDRYAVGLSRQIREPKFKVM
ncbi:hypothetical protein J4212_02680 [Candidatus Woesearchaeota archaeon]|nr:hypothetical protein [Candidatus Woesearchaeota archaeon]